MVIFVSSADVYYIVMKSNMHLDTQMTQIPWLKQSSLDY